jgi:hypothetical protein
MGISLAKIDPSQVKIPYEVNRSLGGVGSVMGRRSVVGTGVG